MLIALYFLIALAEIIGEYNEWSVLIFATKPFLMIILGYWFFKETAKSENSKYRKRLLFSIGFAFGGDTFLMFLPYNENFFLLGLGSFLIGQLFYAFAFIESIRSSTVKAKKSFRLLFLFAFISYYIVLMKVLFNDLGEFLVPVLVYGLAICLMGLTAAWRLHKVSVASFTWVFTGAMLFVISDTIIAINQFMYKGNFWNAQVLIMLTYVMAQFLIAKGSVIYLKSSSTT